MRKILFRAKRPDGKWEMGYYFTKPILEFHSLILGESQWAIDPDTLGQFTGLKDKNGTMVFEGDIVKLRTGRICHVVYKALNGFCGFDLEPIAELDRPVPNDSIFFDCEVIGCVHDLEVRNGG